MVEGVKLSVSVPDDLWDEARHLREDQSPSAVVQAALKSMITEQGGARHYAHPPALDDSLSKALRIAADRLAAEARELYSDGYRAGAELATTLTWRQLEHACQHGIEAAAHADDPEARIDVEGLGEHCSPVTVEGIERALRDFSSAVGSTHPDARPAPERSPG